MYILFKLISQTTISHIIKSMYIQVLYIEGDSTCSDLVVVNPSWLCSHIIGHLLSHEQMTSLRISGCFTEEDIAILFPDDNPMDVVKVGTVFFVVFVVIVFFSHCSFG